MKITSSRFVMTVTRMFTKELSTCSSSEKGIWVAATMKDSVEKEDAQHD